MSVDRALWQIFSRSERPEPWERGGNLPWNDPAFRGGCCASIWTRATAPRAGWRRNGSGSWCGSGTKLGLQPGARVLDLTCGPGLYAVALAERGAEVVGVDFGPASIAHARQLAAAPAWQRAASLWRGRARLRAGAGGV
jgi:2-polyprenyl-3-methyl-5-hydroxy-6-metoxy-1,4-benzoquinol methylase